VESLNERIISHRETLASLSSRSTQRSLDTDRSRSILLAQRASLAEQRAALARSGSLVLTAPVAGRVGDIGVEIGQRARTDHALVTLIPEGSRLEVWLYAPTRATGFVRPGQRVRLKFDAFPYQKYGLGLGTVTAVAAVALEPSSIDPGLGIEEPVFRIRVRLDQAAPGVRSGISALRPGMTLNADLVLERRSLWESLFAPALGALRS
jgi:membrane fusion protein